MIDRSGLRRASVLTTASLLCLSLPWLAAPPASAAPGDVALLNESTADVTFGGPYAFAHDVDGDGSTVLFQAMETSRIFLGLYVRRADGSVSRIDTNSAGTVGGNPMHIGRGALSDSGDYAVFLSQSPLFSVPDGQVGLVRKNLVTQEADLLAITGTSAEQCGSDLEVSDDGGAVAFSTKAALYGFDGNGVCDVYVWDAVTGVAPATAGSTSVNGMGSELLAMTPDGRYLLYKTDMDTSLPLGGQEGNLFRYDRTTGSRALQSFDANGDALPHGANRGDLSDDGDLVVFQSTSDATLQLGFSWTRSFLRSASTGAITDLTPGRPTVPLSYPRISGDGSHISADVDWTWLTTGAGGSSMDLGVYSVQDGTWQLASHAFGDPAAESDNQAGTASISADGSTVAYTSFATDLLATSYAGPFPSAYTYEVTGLADPDADADGIADVVDADGGVGSLPGQFLDTIAGGPNSFGTITSKPLDMTVTIDDLADPSGVLVTTVGSAGSGRVSVCGLMTLSLRANTTAEVTCGSVLTRVVAGEIVAELGDGTTVTLPAGIQVYFDDLPGGGFAVDVLDAPDGQVATVSKDGATSAIGLADPPTTVQAWTFTGFAQPVDNGGRVNVAKGGSVVPLRWSITAAGAAVTDLPSATAVFAYRSCATGTADTIEETVSRPSTLLNLGGGSYQLNWKTPSGAGCGEIRLDIGDGVLHTAQFRIR